jgi:hypothetical protein
MIARLLVVAALLGCAATVAPAQRAPASPLYERSVTPGAPGANQLAVDVALLAGGAPFEWTRSTSARLRGASSLGGGLGDLRLHDDARGREVPYLLVWPSDDPPSWRDARILRVMPGKDTSGFEADLGDVVSVDRIDILGLPERFLKRVRLEGSGDRVHWALLVAEGTLFNLPAGEDNRGALRQTQLAFSPGTFRYLRVIWDDHLGGRLTADVGARARLAPRGARPADTLRAALSVERRPSARRTTRLHVRLPAARLPIVALDLDVGGEQILRPAFVTEPQLGAGRVGPVQLGSATLRRASSGGAVASSLRIPISTPTGAELDVVIDDGDNPPLEVRGISAVFAPLPYIFFESPDGREIRATYGTDRRQPVAAPQYDLEALRDSVHHIAAARASWGAPRGTQAARTAAAAPKTSYAAPGAALDVKSFRYARAIPAGSGLTAVRLDPAAFAHSHIDDVRVVDGEGRQVPYLLEVLDEPTEVALPAVVPTKPRENIDRRHVADADSRTWYRLRLPYAGLPQATLRLSTTARVFSREIGIVTRDLPREARAEASLDRTVNASWTHDDPESPAPPLEIALGARLSSDSLFVLVGDGDNQKLPIAGATLLLPSYRIRFFREPGAALTLLYGRGDLGAPRYDLQLIAPRLLDAPADEVRPAPEGGGTGAPSDRPQIVFWAVLGVAVLVLLVLIARLVSGAASAPSAPLSPPPSAPE